MKIGFLTNCFNEKDIIKVSSWAKENGFLSIEVGPFIELDEEKFIKVREKNVEIVSFIYCRNFHSTDEKERKKHYHNLLKRIEFASKTGVKYVTTSTGRDESKSLEDNIKIFEDFFTPILEKAKNYKVTISLENCPSMGNIAFSPYMWQKIFEIFPSDNLKLTFDPSHLVWQEIDCYKALEGFVDKVAYLHMKDTEILRDVLEDRGILQSGWWRYRLPGWGKIDWKRIITILAEHGFDGVLSIEHEDPVWSGSRELVEKGLIKARDFIKSLI